ncbi:MAG: sulfatase-like hydrolase/transferase [Gimesia sp.]|nr:sulfatase-like hydrolase/transferase [Gimesia sp.]
MNRCLYGMLSLLLLFVSIAQTSAAPPQKNVLVIVVDDQGFQAGCYGNKVIKTPGIDTLAASGTRFSRAHCTTASCSASRSVIMTGLYNHATGHYGHAHGYNHFSTYAGGSRLPNVLDW